MHFAAESTRPRDVPGRGGAPSDRLSARCDGGIPSTPSSTVGVPIELVTSTERRLSPPVRVSSSGGKPTLASTLAASPAALVAESGFGLTCWSSNSARSLATSSITHWPGLAVGWPLLPIPPRPDRSVETRSDGSIVPVGSSSRRRARKTFNLHCVCGLPQTLIYDPRLP